MTDDEEEGAPLDFGSIEFAGKDIHAVESKFDRIAVDSSGSLYLLSVVAEPQKIKQMRAILSGGVRASVMAAGVDVKRPDGTSRYLGGLSLIEGGYDCWSVKLGFSQTHAVFMSRSPGFMPVLSDASLWRELNDSRFTTPVVEEWLPYIKKSLIARNLLRPCLCFNCASAVLLAKTSLLDEIVQTGIKDRLIHIPSREVA
jgi:hypothetical protein